jgi:3-hydroxyacyl-CoA dehydrogenase
VAVAGTPEPLRPGCAGGKGGRNGGGAGGPGGGALQISAAGELKVTDVVSASGAGGAGANGSTQNASAGGGGGSGGTLVLEGDTVVLTSSARLTSNGGGGGGGAENSTTNVTAGEEGPTHTQLQAEGGSRQNSDCGRGGAGGSAAGPPVKGENGIQRGAGGGGGGTGLPLRPRPPDRRRKLRETGGCPQSVTRLVGRLSVASGPPPASIDIPVGWREEDRQFHPSENQMSIRIRKVAVLGAGVMGSGIAAHLANAGIPSVLLDIVPPRAAEGEKTDSAAFRNKFAQGALANLRKQKPAPLFSTAALDLIEVGNLEDDLGRLAGCDWVVEVVKEDMAIKQATFARVESHIRPGTIVSSNTSGLSITGMLEGRGAGFRKNFLVTHFFNPVRYMKLLELVAGPDTSPDVMRAMHAFGEEVLGKGIVYGKDTTNFIANRIGVYGMMRTIAEMQKAELSVEEVDKIFGPAMGRPKSAVFRTADIVGLDTFVHVAQNCYDTLAHDEEREVFRIPGFLQKMVEQGWLGDKSGQGFYKKEKKDGGKEILSLDLTTLEYRPQQKVRYDSLGAAKEVEDVRQRVVTVMRGEDKAARFAERVTLDVLAYASRRIPEIADDIVNIDRGMRWGFAWDVGPFEAWDAYGVAAGVERMKALGLQPAAWVEKMLASGRTSFYAVEGTADTYWDIAAGAPKKVPENPRTQRVEYLKRGNRKIRGNDGATLWDLGEGCTLLEFHSKMNSIDDAVIEMMNAALDETEQNHRALVVGNDGANFSVGANLMALLWAVNSDDLASVEKLVEAFQRVNQRMRYSPVPVVTAPFGLTLGGGAEVTMGGNAVQAAAETYIGLVEVGVGLIPGGGGNLQLLRNVYGPYASDKDFDPLPFLKKVFLTIGTAKVAVSAEEAREAGFLGPDNGISLNRDFLLSDARARALGMAQAGFRPPRKMSFRLPGPSGAATIDMLLYDMQLNNQISEHDRTIGRKLARVLTGGDTSPSTLVTEDRLLELEREAFLSLLGEEKTRARMMHMLEKGKPLRN